MGHSNQVRATVYQKHRSLQSRVMLIGFCVERTKLALVYEYMPNGSLDKYILKQEQGNASNKI
ncbi:hypothetical protein HN873_024681 [Arachis hypogaea]